MKKLPFCILCFAAAFLLIWPALFNGGPFFFPDTPSYIRGADVGVSRFLHHQSAWSLPSNNSDTKSAGSVYQGSEDKILANWKHHTLQDVVSHGIILGRSIYYGIFLYIGYVLSNFWLTIYLQALLVVSSIFLLMRHLGLLTIRAACLAAAFTAIGTCAGFVSSLLMPDILVGVGLLGLAVLATSKINLRPWKLWYWGLVLCAAQLGHDSAFLITLIFSFIFLLTLIFDRDPKKMIRIGVLVCTLLIAFLGQSFYKIMIKRGTGTEPFRMPYLTARLIADGPGATYLRDTCPSSGFIVCNYVDKLPLSFETFLFAAQADGGVFMQAPPAVRRQLASEQVSFFLHVLRHSPGAVTKEFLRNLGRQLTTYDLGIYRYDRLTAKVYDSIFPGALKAKVARTRAYERRMPVEGLAIYFDIVTCLSCLYLVYATAMEWKNRTLSKKIVYRVLGWVCVGIILNAVVCGTLSGVYGRFGTRAIWLVPVMACIIWMERRNWMSVAVKRRSHHGPPAIS